MKFKKPIIWAASIVIICIVAIAMTQPVLVKAILAKYKSTDHFLILKTDNRIRYEATAKQNALILSGFLSDSQGAVERTLDRTHDRHSKKYSTKEIQRCLKRYIARELYPLILGDLQNTEVMLT